MSEKRKDNKGRLLKTGESQRNDGRYQFRYIDIEGNRQINYSWKLVKTDKTPVGKKDDSSLREKEESIRKDLESGIQNKNKEMTLNDAFKKYIKLRGSKIKLCTKTNYEGMWKKNLEALDTPNMLVFDIRKSDIIILYQELMENGLSYGTIIFFNKIISALFHMLLDEDIITRNPMRRCLKEIEGRQTIREALTVDQQNELLVYAKTHNYDLYVKILFQIKTMCRVSEMAGLNLDEIDIENKIISIDHQLQYGKVENEAIARSYICLQKITVSEMSQWMMKYTPY